MEAYPEVLIWIIGGHSLGGVMAAKYVYSEPTSFSGLILLASYPNDSNNLSEFTIPVITIYGSLDGVLSVEIPETLSLLPSMSTTMVEIVGGNHANFGSYGDQKGDNQASIPRATQQFITIDQITQFIETI